MREATINELLRAKGIETRSADIGVKALYRGDEFLGVFTARAAVERFLRDEESAQ